MARTFSIQVNGKFMDFESRLSDLEALNILSNLQVKPDFVKSILSQSSERSLSHMQRAWVHKLALEKLAKDARAEAAGHAREPVPNLKKLVTMFDTASSNIKSPKVTFPGFSLVRDSEGGVIIKSGFVLCGRISPDGAFKPTVQAPDAVLQEVVKLAEDPVSYASMYGKASGRCCFCNKCLKESRSMAMGYGPVCANSYGLEWGKSRRSSNQVFGMD
jgi:hypothetical protein